MSTKKYKLRLPKAIMCALALVLSTVVTPLIQNNAFADASATVQYKTGVAGTEQTSKTIKSYGRLQYNPWAYNYNKVNTTVKSLTEILNDAPEQTAANILNSIENQNYLFTGWKVESDTQTYVPGNDISGYKCNLGWYSNDPSGCHNVTLVAQWVLKEQVTVNGNTVTNTDPIEIKDVDENVTGTITIDHYPVIENNNVVFTLVPAEGYVVDTFTVNDVDSVEEISEEGKYTASNVNESINITVAFVKQFEITVSVEGAIDSKGQPVGDVNPQGQLVKQGEDATVGISILDAHYEVISITDNGDEVEFPEGGILELKDVEEDHEIVVTFGPIKYNLVVECDEGGEAYPASRKSFITYEDAENIHISAKPGYHITEIFSDGANKTGTLEDVIYKNDKLIGASLPLSEVESDTTIYVKIEADEYEVLEGDDQVFNAESEDDLVIRFSGDYDLFEKLYIDGKEVSEEKYTAESGSTVVTVKHDYLVGLGNGAHDIKALYANGNYASADFEIYGIPEAPDTGFFQMKTENAGVNASFAAAAIAALATLVVFRRKKAAKNA